MKIKDRLALYFTLISTVMLLGVLVVVYFTFLKFTEQEFFARLTDRTMVTAKLYLEADEISSDSLNKVRTQYFEKLNSEVLRIYDAKNTATFIGDDQQYWTERTIDEVREKKKIQFRDGDRQVVGIYYKDNQGDFVILASAIDKGTITRVQKLLKIMIGVFIVILICLLLTARWIAKRILLPLDEFIAEVKLIKSNNLHFRVKEGENQDEIALLASNFNNLIAHLEHAFVLQKTFVANASHELRTPITRMVIGAEIALSQERPAEDYKKSLTGVLDDAEKLENIIASLLSLAEADLEYTTTTLENVRIDELLWQIQEQWKQKLPENQLFVEFGELAEDADRLIIPANPTLLQIAIDNIISNGFKFSDHQPVTCKLELRADGIHLDISDQGPGISKTQQQHIFQPFYTSSVKEAHKGNGMGLYMAYKIIGLYHGNITIKSQKGIGTTFQIRFE
ncbi:sensor histidine kinase [Pedobacter duraquae]|uniref:histidine kinase n=1 Tax=Pedobacter duraquae TaxID=425511 RepID=A0A4R6IR04_9SPHI|nr:sensor histidine kinase [Pedobacter duraquae]TDO24834.1 signal transduction histidine kinase [Pedobacter duraquae]